MSALVDYPLPEHPDATQRRLRESGDWVEAEQIFSEVRQRRYNQLRKTRGGAPLSMSARVEANREAWQAVYQLYPVPEGAVPLPSLAEHLQGRHRLQRTKKLPPLNEAHYARFDEIGTTSDPGAEVLWVYANIENYSVDPMECPSRGAWAMLSHARRDNGWFYEKMYRPIAQDQAKLKAKQNEGEYVVSKAEKMAVAEIDQMIQQAVEASAK